MKMNRYCIAVVLLATVVGAVPALGQNEGTNPPHIVGVTYQLRP